jgi:hypothetical protein
MPSSAKEIMNPKEIPFNKHKHDVRLSALLATSALLGCESMAPMAPDFKLAKLPKPKIITKYDKEAIRKAEEKRKRKGKP